MRPFHLRLRPEGAALPAAAHGERRHAARSITLRALESLGESPGDLLIELILEQCPRALAEDDAGFYFLMAAARLSRAKLKIAQQEPAVKIAPRSLRRAFALKQHLPPTCAFDAVLEAAAALRAPDMGRKGSGDVERILRERLIEEGIPIVMAPPIRGVAGVLTRANRKPDGVFPDPATGLAPKVYLEIKRVNRVSDDIQKRLYEIAEVSLEMKTLYGQLTLKGLNLGRTEGVLGNTRLRNSIRDQIVESLPAVVALLICSKTEAEPYRSGAETFVDRVFFQEETEECIEFLKNKCLELGVR